jgi:cation-transporting ATPase 13A1
MASSAPLVDNAQIRSAELLRPLPFYMHTYVWPFAIAWPVFLRYYLTQDLYDKHIGGEEWTFVWVGSIITVQSLVWLSTHWSVHIRARFTASKVADVKDAEQIKVIPIANAGSGEVCNIVRDKVSSFHYIAMACSSCS